MFAVIIPSRLIKGAGREEIELGRERGGRKNLGGGLGGREKGEEYGEDEIWKGRKERSKG